MLVQVLAAALPARFTAQVSGKAAEDGPCTQGPGTHVGTWLKPGAPGFGMDHLQPLVKQWRNDFSIQITLPFK